MSESIHTLQEFMLHTKGVLYVLAVAYLVGFVCFWKFLLRNDRGKETD